MVFGCVNPPPSRREDSGILTLFDSLLVENSDCGRAMLLLICSAVGSMVSFHQEWDDVEDGFEKDSTGVYVKPAIVSGGEHSRHHRSGDIPPEEANCYSVSLRTRMRTSAETWDPVACFADARDAWEFAHLLTHFFSGRHDPWAQKSDLLHDNTLVIPDDAKQVPDIVEELSAEKVLERMLHPHPVPDRVKEAFNTASN